MNSILHVEIEFESRPHIHSYHFRIRSTSKVKKLFDSFVGFLNRYINTDDIKFYYDDGTIFPIRLHLNEPIGNHVLEEDATRVKFYAKLMKRQSKRGHRKVSTPTFKRKKNSQRRRRHSNKRNM